MSAKKAKPQKKPETTESENARTKDNGQPDSRLIPGKNVIVPPGGGNPARVSGMFEDDPAFEEFLQILREQREEDLRQTIREIEAETAREANPCSSSTPTPSRARSAATRSSRKK